MFLGVEGRLIQQCTVWKSKGGRRAEMEKVQLELGNSILGESGKGPLGRESLLEWK